MKQRQGPARKSARIALAPVVLALAALALPLLGHSQAATAPTRQAGASAPVQPHAPAARSAASGSRAGKAVTVAKPATRPAWRDLSPGQQQALAPLAAQWDTLGAGHKRKWIALSANYLRMSADEQAKLHSRMTEWVSLSPQQRTIARLNYGVAKKLTPEDKKAKWEAYQALPPEEKKKLAARAAKPPSTAAEIRPVPADKLAATPAARSTRPAPASKAPRISAGPDQIDRRTLLPQPVPEPEPQPEPPHAGADQ